MVDCSIVEYDQVYIQHCSGSGRGTCQILRQVGDLVLITDSQIVINSLHSRVVFHLLFAFQDLLEHIPAEVVPLPHDGTKDSHSFGVVEWARAQWLPNVVPRVCTNREAAGRAEQERVGVPGGTLLRRRCLLLLIATAHLVLI